MLYFLALMDEEWQDGKLKCHDCGQYKDPSEFLNAGPYSYTLRNNKATICKDCRLKRSRDKLLEEEAKVMKILQSRWLGARTRAKDQCLEFTITKEDLYNLWVELEGRCAISNLQMTYDEYKGRVYTNVSIDKINPKEGYTRNNILLVCMGINLLKSNFTMEEVFTMCKAVVKNSANWHNKNASKWKH